MSWPIVLWMLLLLLVDYGKDVQTNPPPYVWVMSQCMMQPDRNNRYGWFYYKTLFLIHFLRQMQLEMWDFVETLPAGIGRWHEDIKVLCCTSVYTQTVLTSYTAAEKNVWDHSVLWQFQPSSVAFPNIRVNKMQKWRNVDQILLIPTFHVCFQLILKYALYGL